MIDEITIKRISWMIGVIYFTTAVFFSSSHPSRCLQACRTAICPAHAVRTGLITLKCENLSSDASISKYPAASPSQHAYKFL